MVLFQPTLGAKVHHNLTPPDHYEKWYREVNPKLNYDLFCHPMYVIYH